MQQVFDIFFEDEDERPASAVRDFRVERNLARAAEFFVAYDISRRGFDVFTVGEGLRYDLIADVAGLRRFQIKSNRRATYRAPGAVSTSYTFGNKYDLRSYANDIDAFAFVAMDIGVVLYALPAQIAAMSFHIKSAKMTPEASDLSWQQVLRFWGLE